MCGATNDVQQYWTKALPKYFGVQYQQTKTRLFDAPRQTGCGMASPQTGPFYCPADFLVYIDLGFLQQIEKQFVGATSDLAEQYIMAHEYGHHVQNVLGTNAKVQAASRKNPKKANQYSVALELQADCYAGVWGSSASRRGLLESGDVEEGLQAAAAIGDDRLRKMGQGRVVPETFTHGSSADRVAWLRRGLERGTLEACDTFNGSEIGRAHV
mgnify:CR=1 FL=1